MVSRSSLKGILAVALMVGLPATSHGQPSLAKSGLGDGHVTVSPSAQIASSTHPTRGVPQREVSESEARQLTIGELLTALRGSENSLRHYADLVGTVALAHGWGMAAVIDDADPNDIEVIHEEWPNMCRPPWCRKSPALIRSEISGLPDRVQAAVNATKALLGHLPHQNTGLLYYSSEVPGTHWNRGSHHENAAAKVGDVSAHEPRVSQSRETALSPHGSLSMGREKTLRPQAKAATSRQLTVEELLSELRGAENALRHYADLVGTVAITQGGGALAVIRDVEPSDIDIIREEWWNLCFPPMCRKSPALIRSEIVRLPERVLSAVNATSTLLNHLPDQNKGMLYYSSEVPGTHWTPKAHTRENSQSLLTKP